MDFRDKFDTAASSGKDLANQKIGLMKKQFHETTLHLNVTQGRSQIPTTLGNATLQIQDDNRIYFRKEPDVFYTLVGFNWGGPRYRTESHTDVKGKERGETKRKGRLLGAAVGTILLPGIGTAIGAGVGSGNKKSSKNMESHSVSYDEQVEVPTPASLILCNCATGKTISFNIQCNAAIGNALAGIVCATQEQIAPSSPSPSIEAETESYADEEVIRHSKHGAHAQNDNTDDPFTKVKKLKELLDMGALTQAEFDAKKTEILHL
jgi:hypothetical protein